MDSRKKLFLKNYLSNLRVETLEKGHLRVWPDWRDIDYVPGYNKFYLIQGGEGLLVIDGARYYPKPGQMFLMPQGVKQSYTAINENTFTKYWCHFTARVGDMNLFDIIKLPYFIDIEDMDVPESLFKQLIDSEDSLELTAALRSKAAMLGLISYYLENARVDEVNISSADSMEKLNAVLDYIDCSLSENISVEKLAQIVHLHPNYFIKVFRRHLGSSPINYINHRRIDKAKFIIETTDDTLASIADRIGIGDVYYLSKLFKEYTGFSPSEYRKLRKGRA